jgi:hypothetical protein
MDAADSTAEVFAALDRLIGATDGFVAVWGEADPAMVERLEGKSKGTRTVSAVSICESVPNAEPGR